RRDRLVRLDAGEQDIGALADAVDQLHVVDHAVAEGQTQVVEQRVLGFRLEHEVDHAARFLGRDVEALADFRHVTGQQQCRGLGQALVQRLDGDLLQVRVP
nr:hypothetical protein [Tanacetum cinerariifolium]